MFWNWKKSCCSWSWMKTSLLYPKTHSETLLLLPAVPFPGWTWKELPSGHFRWWLHYRMAWRILPLFSPLLSPRSSPCFSPITLPRSSAIFSICSNARHISDLSPFVLYFQRQSFFFAAVLHTNSFHSRLPIILRKK